MKKGIIKYIICLLIIYVIIFLVTFLTDQNKTNSVIGKKVFKNEELYINRNITESNDKYNIDVMYPKYKSSKLNKEVTNYIYDYIDNFKKDCNKNCNLNIEYEIYNISNYSNIFFKINSSINEYDKYYNILLDNKNEKKVSIDLLFSSLKEQIDNKLTNKYPSLVSDVHVNETLNDYIYYITDDYIKVFFKHYEYEIPVSYDVNVEIYFLENKRVYNIDPNKKLISLTFDDGPSEYSINIMKTLIENDSKATFFVIGNKLEKQKDILLKEYQEGFLIGSHTYDHKYLTKLTEDEILKELNSTNIIYNSITGSNIELLRPPYGSYNDNVKRITNMPLILWDIDTNDWYYRDAEIVYNSILTASDGDIVLMHDVYPETLEAVKRAVPELKARGYELVTVSDLARYKNVELIPGNAYRFIR